MRRLMDDNDSRVRRCDVPGRCPASPSVVEKKKVFDIASHKDPTTLGGQKQMLIILIAISAQLARGYGTVAGCLKQSRYFLRHIMIEVEVCQRVRPKARTHETHSHRCVPR